MQLHHNDVCSFLYVYLGFINMLKTCWLIAFYPQNNFSIIFSIILYIYYSFPVQKLELHMHEACSSCFIAHNTSLIIFVCV